MATIQRLPGSIYVTRLDYGRLTDLVRQPPPGASPELVTVLGQELARAQLVDSYEILPHVVTMNSRLKLRQLRSDDELCFTLTYPPAADEAAGQLSVLSPLGVAVLGCCLGDQFQLQQPGGPANYWVEAILHQPEAAGDWDS
ncbi:GreA/GreB family elongation factor [Hymenobacter nivis]|uniref:Transcription elongation factor GreAB n=1 Tax=Hymenobacter nivis TaxID=1850093 RepID=A0A502HFB9_9BACT|nr:GreA/GreB family elongation factor [Hymenobacter nivis]TPG71918.1 transcription elongation factor GreAB [Hymenobacter nivis]